MMERTAAAVIASGFFQIDIRTDHLDYIGAVNYLVYYFLADHVKNH